MNELDSIVFFIDELLNRFRKLRCRFLDTLMKSNLLLMLYDCLPPKKRERLTSRISLRRQDAWNCDSQQLRLKATS
jgi:hypothetical protein